MKALIRACVIGIGLAGLPAQAQVIEIVEVDIPEIWIFDPQDTGQNARDEPFFIRYDGTRDLSEDCIRPPAVPVNANRGANTVDVGGRALNVLQFELWERDGDDYDCRYDEEDGTAGSDNRLGTISFDSSRRIRVANGERGSLNIWRSNFQDGRTYYIPIRTGEFLYYITAVPQVIRVDLSNLPLASLGEGVSLEAREGAEASADEGFGLDALLADFRRQVVAEISNGEVREVDNEDPAEE